MLKKVPSARRQTGKRYASHEGASTTHTVLTAVPWQVVLGLAFVVISSAFASVTPWLLRAAHRRIRDGRRIATHLDARGRQWSASLSSPGFSATGCVSSSTVSVDESNTTSATTSSYISETRRGLLRAHAHRRHHGAPHERPERGAQAAGPAIMYLTNTIAGGVFRARIHAAHRRAAHASRAHCRWCCCRSLTIRLGRAIHERFEAVQEHSARSPRARRKTSPARASCARIVRSAAEIERFAALNDEYLDEEHAARAAVRAR